MMRSSSLADRPFESKKEEHNFKAYVHAIHINEIYPSGHAADDPEKLSFPVAEGLWKESRISEDLATDETQELESVEALETKPEEVVPSVNRKESQDEGIT